MSQSGTQTQMVFMNWRKKFLSRWNESSGIGVTRTTRYTQKFKTLEVSRLGLPVSHSGQKVIHLRQHLLHAVSKSKCSDRSLTLHKVQQ